jgi:arsenite methyltransferase
MSQEETIRRNVSEVYARAVDAPADTGCCAGPVQKGVAVKLAGYTPEELAALPSAAVVNSFGCGNPLAFAEVREGDVVLDLGSGAGIDLLLAAKKVGPTGRAIGVDMTDPMIAQARRNVAAAGLTNVEVRQGLIERLPVESESVDWVISNCVINLSPEKPKVFAEIARVLKPGGRLRVSDIVAQDLPDEVRRDPQLYSSCIAGAISEEAYLAGLRQAGLVDVQVRERLVYDAAQLRQFVESELPAAGQTSCCGGGGGDPIADRSALLRLVDAVAGKIWSALIYARKHGG